MAPITILTGENSAGKSSMVKALMMLGDMLDRVDGNFHNLENFYLDFAETNNKYGLGRFSKVINKSAGSNGEIELSHSYHSVLASQDLVVKYTFAPASNDDFDNGHLVRFSLLDNKGNTVFVLNRDLLRGNDSIVAEEHCLKDSFLKFGWIFLIDELDVYKQTEGVIGNYSQERVDAFQSKIDDGLAVLKKMGLTNKDFQAIREKRYNKGMPSWYSKVCQDLPKMYAAWKEFSDSKCLVWNPLLKEVSDVSKNDMDSYLNKRYANEFEKHPLCRENIRLILDDFSKSQYDNFIDYYLSQESQIIWSQNWESCEDTLVLASPWSMPGAWQMGSEFDESPSNFGFDKLARRCNKNLIQGSESDRASYTIQFLLAMEQLHNPSEWNPNEHGVAIDEFGTVTFTFAMMYRTYFYHILGESVTPVLTKRARYIGSNCVQAQRLYTLDRSDDDMVKLLLQYRQAKQHFANRYLSLEGGCYYQPNDFARKWLKMLSIGDDLIIGATEDGLGVTMKLKKGDDVVMLADEGYGITQLVYVILQIESCILESEWDLDHDPVGSLESEEGLSWSKKLGKCKGMLLAIEEPENHLHPALQSKLADMFLDAYENYNIRFIVETHSEYLIRESQVLVSKMGFQSNKESDENSPFRTYYIPKDGKPYSLGYRKDGRFAEKFGDGFYNESTILTNKML